MNSAINHRLLLILVASSIFIVTGAGILFESAIAVFGCALVTIIIFIIVFRSNLFTSAILFNLYFMLLAFPIGGMLISSGGDLELLKYIVGTRSIVSLTLIVACLVFIRTRMSVLLVLFLAVGTVKNGVSVESLTYLFNSFGPLFLGLYFLSYVADQKNNDALSFGGCFDRDIVKFIIILLAVSVLFNVSLYYVSYDIFRPDLFFSYRSRLSYIPHGDFPRPWSTRIGDFEFFRMTGSMFDPIQWGYACATAFLTLTFFKQSSKFHISHRVVQVFLILFIILSGSKGAWLFTLGVLSLYFATFLNRKFLVPCYVVFCAISFYAISLGGNSGIIHLLGLIGGIQSSATAGISSMLFGHGFGSGGNLGLAGLELAELRQVWLKTGAESGFGVLIYQTGFLGVLLYYILTYRLLKNLLKSRWIDRKHKSCCVTAIIVYNMLLMLQENLINSSIFLVFSFMIYYGISFSKGNKSLFR